MVFDSENYDINSKLMEWWRQDLLLEPINRYSQDLIKKLIGSLLSSFGVVQPFHVWKTLPTEYNWLHTYTSYDQRLKTEEEGLSPLTLNKDTPIRAYVPNTKRNCHALIQLQLTGGNQDIEKPIEKLTIKNQNQTLVIKNITTMTDIKISTKDGSILIDGAERNDLVYGKINKIYPQPNNPNFDKVDIYDENKQTYISIESTETTNFKLKIKLLNPIYVTEQNMRIHTVSAFPIEFVKLYGLYCNEFNNKEEWKFLWEKQYSEDDRVVFDRITKQFDCETFYMQVKLHGIGVPFVIGFPQQEFSTNPAFQTNKFLDKWGKILSLPRRYYKTKIPEDEEYRTYPPYYLYDIEQDYYYEQRLVNEYRYNDDAINSALIKDSDFNNVGILKCINPYSDDIFVYTETIKNTTDDEYQTNPILPDSDVMQINEGVEWENPSELCFESTSSTEISLSPKSSKSFNPKQYQAKVLRLNFKDIPDLPKDIEIKGIELQLNGLTNIHSDSLYLDDRTQMLLPTIYTKENGEVFKTIDPVQINTDIQNWEKGKSIYKIGGPTNLFGLDKIKREQIINGLTFDIGITNNNEFIKAEMALYSVKLIIYYKRMKDDYDIDVKLSSSNIILDDPDKQDIKLLIDLKNTGEIPIQNKMLYIAHATGIDVTKTRFPPINLDIEENFVIGEGADGVNDSITITPTKYEMLQLKQRSEISREIDISNIGFINFYYKMNNKATIDVYVNDEKIDSFSDNMNSWQKYSYEIKKCDRIENIDNPDCEENGRNWGDTVILKICVSETENNVFIKNPLLWQNKILCEVVNEVKTGLYDIVVFCDEKAIKKTITVKQTDIGKQVKE